MVELAIPHLRILDYHQAVAFYVDTLGFEIELEWRSEPDLPVYMGIRRGTLLAHLSEHEASGPPGEGRGVTLAVANVDAWYEELKGRDSSSNERSRASLGARATSSSRIHSAIQSS